MEKLIRIKDAAKVLGVTQNTLYRWVNEGVVPSTRLGGLHAFRSSDLDQILKDGIERPRKKVRRQVSIETALSPYLDLYRDASRADFKAGVRELEHGGWKLQIIDEEQVPQELYQRTVHTSCEGRFITAVIVADLGWKTQVGWRAESDADSHVSGLQFIGHARFGLRDVEVDFARKTLFECVLTLLQRPGIEIPSYRDEEVYLAISNQFRGFLGPAAKELFAYEVRRIREEKEWAALEGSVA